MMTVLQQLGRSRLLCFPRPRSAPARSALAALVGTVRLNHCALLQRQSTTMSADEPESSKSALKRSLEDAGLDGDTATRSREAPRLDDNTDSQPPTPLTKDDSASVGPSTRGEKGRNSRVPIPRRQAREARRGQPMRRGTRPEGERQQGDDDDGDKGPRLPKRQCALLIGFCGSGYSGMQLYVLSLVDDDTAS